MGHVEICIVLSRSIQEQSDGEDSSDDETSVEEDIVFEVTSKYVAVKVNYSDRIEKLKGRHAEDPLG